MVTKTMITGLFFRAREKNDFLEIRGSDRTGTIQNTMHSTTQQYIK